MSLLNVPVRASVQGRTWPMKTITIGILACVLLIPVSADAASKPRSTGDKFESIIPLNYTRVSGSRGASAGYRGGYAYRGAYGYRGGYYGRGRYGGYYPGRYGYGYRYPYGGYYGGWYGGYYPYSAYGGFPYYSGFAYGAGWPGYSGGYYGAGPFVANQPPLLLPAIRTASNSRSSNGSSGSFITHVQSALKNQGYYAGPLDGDFGPSSQKAFATFQQAKGMPPTGTLDSPALAALGVGGKSTRSTAKSAPVPPRKSLEATFEPPPIGSPDQPPAVTAPEPPLVATPAQPPVIPREPPPIPGGS